jgi:hypothetical protein
MLCTMVSSIPHSIFYTKEFRLEVVQQLGVGFILVLLANMFTSPFLIFTEILYILKYTTQHQFTYVQTFAPLIFLLSFISLVCLMVGCNNAAKSTRCGQFIAQKITLVTGYGLITGILLLAFTVDLAKTWDNEEDNNDDGNNDNDDRDYSYRQLFIPLFIWHGFHLVISALCASRMFFYGTIFGDEQQQEQQENMMSFSEKKDRLFYTIFLLISNLTSFTSIMLVMRLDRDLEIPMAVVLLPLFIILAFVIVGTLVDAKIIHNRKIRRKLEKYWTENERRPITEDLALLLNNKAFSDIK